MAVSRGERRIQSRIVGPVDRRYKIEIFPVMLTGYGSNISFFLFQ